MKLLTKPQREKLIKNHTEGEKNRKPVVKLFGGSSCTWLLSELDPETNICFGLCDLGMGFPELGDVSLDELIAIKFPPFGLPIERDKHFEAEKTLSEYANEANKLGYIKA